MQPTSPSTAFRVALLIISVLFFGCRENQASPYQYVMPEKTSDGWPTASLTSVHLDAGLISNLFERIGDQTYKNISSVVLIKDGKLVAEEYFPRQDNFGDARARALRQVQPLQLYSATKSVTSILIGLAIEQHLIPGVDAKISSFFPEYADIFKDEKKAGLCLKDFLTMSAGMSWDEWTYPYADPRNDALKTLLSPDLIRYVLERPMIATPGAKFTYNTGISAVLGQIIYKASGLRADQFAGRYLFEPLGITDYYWAKLPGDLVETGGGLFLRPRDMAKLGYLFLNGGRWQGKQIINAAWIRESTKNAAGAMQQPSWLMAVDGYGYQWWLGSFKVADRKINFYSARGRGGQYILVLPDCQMVAVFTGLNDGPLMNQPLDMMQRYILPAVSSQPK